MSAWISQRVFAEPLADLGTETPAFAGIHTPKELPRRDQGRRDGAVSRERRAISPELFRYRILELPARQRARCRRQSGSAGRIIDIGSGSGNSVIPLADRFPNAEIVATDISPQLLAILRDFLRKRSDGDQRFGLVCVDAMAARYQRRGRKSRGRRRDPAPYSRARAGPRVLLPRARARWLGDLLRAVRSRQRAAQVHVPQDSRCRHPARKGQRRDLRFIEHMVEDYRRRERPRSDPIYRELDDKWMFTRTYFERMRATQGWSELITYALNVSADGSARSGNRAPQIGRQADACVASGMGLVGH